MAEHIDDQERQSQEGHTRTIEELFGIALTIEDEDAEWEAIAALHRQNSRDVFEQARKLCISGGVRERRVGACILAQLGLPESTFHEEVVAVLLGMLEREQEPEVLNSLAVALGHRRDPRAVEPLVRFKSHPDDCVRFGVVFGLMCHEDKLAIQALIELSTDPDANVRDWATFALGRQIEIDISTIREALVVRLTDEDIDTRSEAIVGLACRHDLRMVEPLIVLLEDGEFGSLLAEAAAEIGDPRLYPVLVQIREEWKGDKDGWLYRELEEAIEKCQKLA